MLIPPPWCGAANAKGGGTEREIDDMLWTAVELTVADHFAVSALVLSNGQGRDKRPTSGSTGNGVALEECRS